MSDTKIKVVLCGLGPLGFMTADHITSRKGLELVGAVDINPDLVGKDLGELSKVDAAKGIAIGGDLAGTLKETGAQVCVLTTVSDLKRIRPQVEAVLNCGVHVVSTCEELSFPTLTDPGFCTAIDALAKEKSVGVIGTGVNPGFLMDFLPQAMTCVCRDVKKVLVERFQDANHRRLPFQRKIGAGDTMEEFEARKAAGTLRHVGLTESIQMIATQFGWKLDKVEDIIKPVVAETKFEGKLLNVEPGQALGVMQTGHGYCNGEELITLIFHAAVGTENPRDRIVIDGTPKIDSTIAGGVHGDVATCAITTNAIRSITIAAPGLRTMVDMPTPAWFE
jgi:hypothetical protein